MIKNLILITALSITMLSGSSMAFAGQISMEDKVQLQTSMQRYIQSVEVDGVIPHVNLGDGTIADLVAIKAHPMILEFGDKFVVCTDFRDPEGKFVNVDFYISKGSQGYVVFQTEINNRAPLENLMKAGKVSMID